MRIWHEQIIPKLCRKHLLACWRESLGCWNILSLNKQGYSHHPQVKEFKGHSGYLSFVIHLIRTEMLKRGYNPKPIPHIPHDIDEFKPSPTYKRWQTLAEQRLILKAKCCRCRV